ncbi:hypothetical protein [Hymenobacter volaticus]|uniref:Uncharacterized protein n=1 Tax=Hymenobacter volaticus TaxID=2932254 RepID=A0ABY4GBI8_9BACT|nr:hypothetical protein [Hymenobacter volaticus]UOQ68258.1 hypothetical protein MUN86_10625 [Hymenobacter volaticus]
MKKLILIICIFWCKILALAQNIDANNPVFVLPIEYQIDTVSAEFGIKFKTEDEKKNFKNLRNFLSEKEGLLRRLRSASDYLHRDNPSLLNSYLGITDNLRALIESDSVRSKSRNDSILVDISRVTNGFRLDWYPFDEFKQLNKRVVYLSIAQIKQKIDDINMFSDDVKNNIKKAGIVDANIRVVEQDIDDCRKQIDTTLAPEYKQQEFRTTISLYFTALIALVLLMFFFVINYNAEKELSKHLLSDNGLQFVTLFVLIIAVVLFGILNILQSSELAAILAGISGYILGRGNAQRST